MPRVFVGFLAVLALSAALSAQYGRSPRSRGDTPPPVARTDAIVVFKGVLKQMKKKEILIEGDDDQLLSIRRNKSTKFFDNDKEIKATDIDLETPVAIEAHEDTDLKMLAVTVKINGHK
jgi:hypothetical protein